MSGLRKGLFGGLALSVLALLTGCPRAGGRRVSPAEAQALLGDPGVLVLDVRTPEEYARGHLPGARLMPLQGLEASLDALSSSDWAEALVYCASGWRSASAADILKRKGWSRVADLQGGLSAWSAAGLPVVVDGGGAR